MHMYASGFNAERMNVSVFSRLLQSSYLTLHRFELGQGLGERFDYYLIPLNFVYFPLISKNSVKVDLQLVVGQNTTALTKDFKCSQLN